MTETEIRPDLIALASTKQHRLDPGMLSRPLTTEQGAAIYRNLMRCPDREVTVTDEAPRPERKALPHISTFKGIIPAGRYATPSLTGNNDADFWEISYDQPKHGKWAGHSFIVVERVIGGQPNAELSNIQQRAACQAIVEYGVWDSSCLFGQLLHYCGDCGAHLTKKESRDRGKGQVCWDKKGSS